MTQEFDWDGDGTVDDSQSNAFGAVHGWTATGYGKAPFLVD